MNMQNITICRINRAWVSMHSLSVLSTWLNDVCRGNSISPIWCRLPENGTSMRANGTLRRLRDIQISIENHGNVSTKRYLLLVSNPYVNIREGIDSISLMYTPYWFMRTQCRRGH